MSEFWSEFSSTSKLCVCKQQNALASLGVCKGFLEPLLFDMDANTMKVKKRAKIRNRCNQAPHLTQDTNGKMTTSQLDITNKSQEVSLFPAGDHKGSINIFAQEHNKNKTEITNDPQKKHCLGSVNILLEGLDRFHGAPTSPLVQMWIKTHRCLVCMKDP